MESFKKLLQKAHLTGRLVSICYNNINWDKRIIGFIITYSGSENYVKLQEVNEYGFFQKIKKLDIQKIMCLEFNDRYNNRLELIIKKRTKNNNVGKGRIIKITPNNAIKIFNVLIVTKQVCTFYFNEYYLTGILSSLSDQQFIVNNVDYSGQKDGFSIYPIKLLSKIRLNSMKEIKIETLYKFSKEIKPSQGSK